MTANRWIRPASNAVFRRYADGSGGVLLNLASGAYHEVNRSGALIWEALGGTGTGSVDELVERVQLAVGENVTEDLREYVVEFISALEERELVEFSD